MVVNTIKATYRVYRSHSDCPSTRATKNFTRSWLVSLALLCAIPTMAQQAFNVEFSDKKISIQANEASLKDIMLDIQDKTGIPVRFVAESEERVSLEFYNLSIESAIGKLTPNHMIVHDLLDGKERIKELIIISDDPSLAKDGESQYLPTGQVSPQNTAAQTGDVNNGTQSDDQNNTQDNVQQNNGVSANGTSPVLTQPAQNPEANPSQDSN